MSRVAGAFGWSPNLYARVHPRLVFEACRSVLIVEWSVGAAVCALVLPLPVAAVLLLTLAAASVGLLSLYVHLAHSTLTGSLAIGTSGQIRTAPPCPSGTASGSQTRWAQYPVSTQEYAAVSTQEYAAMPLGNRGLTASRAIANAKPLCPYPACRTVRPVAVPSHECLPRTARPFRRPRRQASRSLEWE